ncbi:MAG: hypothetical protein CMG63_03200 [Candidatus Marinimicrobia bacterium]|nr:hypothetical protein [Candidatus Neomarinimicrobiota bacterium]
MKNIYIYQIIFALLTFIAVGCRQQYEPLDSDYSQFGWKYYENGNYVEAREWFQEALKEDSTFADAYNGAGWSLGHLGQADSARYYFSSWISQADETSDYLLDYYAGLAFSYNALGNDQQALFNAQSNFFGKQDVVSGEIWCFCHRKDINQIDVRLIQAVSEFRLGKFSDCLETINATYTDLTKQLSPASDANQVDGDFLDLDNSGTFTLNDKLYNGEWIDSTPDGQFTPGEERLFDSYPLFYDVTTVMGRSFLANHLAILAVHTSSQNGKNKLNCNNDPCN